MKRTRSVAGALGAVTALWTATTVAIATAGSIANNTAFPDDSGSFSTYSVNGAVDETNPFFQSLGTNGRACVTCHEPSDAWTVTPGDVQARFQQSKGLDPIFRTNDGSVSPLADVSSLGARRQAYRMLLTKGLIRVGMAMQDSFEFELAGVDDPYGYASAAELSLFRRPLPATNLGFLATVMWDGRETFPGQSIRFDLNDQANAATLGHAQSANPLTDAQRTAIVDFETGLFTAQTLDRDAAYLSAQGATGGPGALSSQPFSIGINDVLSPGFNPRVFTVFDAWANLAAAAAPALRSAPGTGVRDHGANGQPDEHILEARRAIARGQEIFNTRPIAITGVRGLNDALGVETLQGTCTTCHDTPDAGDHSVSLALDIGLTGVDRRTPDLPLYTFRNKTTGETIQTTDPGRALITGKWKDMSKFKGPILRGLAARPPYFHNGSAAALEDVVAFYDQRFSLGLTAQEKSDLIAFLKAL